MPGSGTNALDRGVEALAYARAADGRRAARGALGAALRLDDDPLAQALSAGAARRRGVLRLRDVSDLERLSGDAREPRDRQCGDRQAAPDCDPADGAGGARRCREVLAAAGFSPDLVTLCLDSVEAAARQVARQASAGGDRRLHRQRALRRLGRSERPSGALLLGDVGRATRSSSSRSTSSSLC